MIQVLTAAPIQLSQQLEEHSILRTSDFAKSPPDSMNIVQWIHVMDQAITADAANGAVSYALDRTKLTVPQDSTYVALAQMSINTFNAMPAADRTEPKLAPNRAAAIPKAAAGIPGCPDLCTASTSWWGCTLNMNHCLCNDIELVLGGTTAAMGLAATIFGALAAGTAPAPPAAAVLGVLAIVAAAIAAGAGTYLAAFTWADGKCQNNGAQLKFTWVSPGTPWVAPVC